MVASCFGGVSVTVRVHRIFHRVEMKRDQFLNKPPCWSGLKSRCSEWCLINQVRSVCTTVGGFCALVDLIIGCLCWHVVTELSNKPLCFDNFGMFISFLYTSELRLVPLLKQFSPFCLRIKMELHCPPETATTPSVTAGCGQVFGPLGSSWPHLSFDVSLVHRAKVHHCCTGCGGNTSSTGQTSY